LSGAQQQKRKAHIPPSDGVMVRALADPQALFDVKERMSSLLSGYGHKSFATQKVDYGFIGQMHRPFRNKWLCVHSAAGLEGNLPSRGIGRR
jgi:hypothetical protein